jgi:protein-L-isoaspartate(D-aspartate) O-methyltransferase
MHLSRKNHLVAKLKEKGITNSKVINAISQTPRHLFIDAIFQQQAYDINKSIPISSNQTISQPYTVAKMTQLLLENTESLNNVLEIGTGSGYQTAVLMHIAKKITTIERIKILHKESQLHIQKMIESGEKENLGKVNFIYADGNKGLEKLAPFDGIIITACAQEIPQDLVDQLKLNASLIMPIVKGEGQELICLTKTKDRIERKSFGEVRFVDMLPGIK